MAEYIWLSDVLYPERQRCPFTTLHDSGTEAPFTVVTFSSSRTLDRPIASVLLTVSAETFFALSMNGRPVCRGPAWIGRDFLFNEEVPRTAYALEKKVTMNEDAALRRGDLRFSARVRMNPQRMFESSRGHGAFWLSARVRFCDGTCLVIGTDESWLAAPETAYSAPDTYDGTRKAETPRHAQIVPHLPPPETAPVPPCEDRLIRPENPSLFLAPGEECTRDFPFSRIRAGYLDLLSVSSGTLLVEAEIYETEDCVERLHLTLSGRDHYTAPALQSIGGVRLTVRNLSRDVAVLDMGMIASCYPTPVSASTRTSDAELNAVWENCRHALKYCRQTLHLDSPRHCEPMACTGDYYIQSLMTLFTFGDMRLSAFDVRRTAQMLSRHDGRMFHTTYSLIWVQMLHDTYLFTGDRSLLTDCLEALRLLLARFSSYTGENGLLETPPDYMFVDWLEVDGYSLHHPPKALGQTCLNLFWYGALGTAAELFRLCGREDEAEKAAEKRKHLARAIRLNLWDNERGLFFEGLNTPTEASLLGPYMPPNTEKRYYRMHANVLACCFGFPERSDCRRLLHRILHTEPLGEIQPYFMHFLLEAVYRNGLRERETLRLLEAWKTSMAICPKGLAEGFHKPEPSYRFDYSHAWAGTPAYALPLALSGLKILEPGFRRISLSPSLLGLRFASVEIPTPFGLLRLDMREGEENRISLPPGLECTIREEEEE